MLCGGARAPTSPARPAALCCHSLIFGAITCFTGFLGVVTGAGATRWCRLRTQRADPLVCAVGMLGSAIFICLIFVAAKSSIVGAYVSAAEGARRGVGGSASGAGSAAWRAGPLPRGGFCPLPTQGRPVQGLLAGLEVPVFCRSLGD